MTQETLHFRGVDGNGRRKGMGKGGEGENDSRKRILPL